LTVKNTEKRCVEPVKKIEEYFVEFKYENLLDRLEAVQCDKKND